MSRRQNRARRRQRAARAVTTPHTTPQEQRYEVYGVDAFEMGGCPGFGEEPRYHLAWCDSAAEAIDLARHKAAEAQVADDELCDVIYAHDHVSGAILFSSRKPSAFRTSPGALKTS